MYVWVCVWAAFATIHIGFSYIHPYNYFLVSHIRPNFCFLSILVCPKICVYVCKIYKYNITNNMKQFERGNIKDISVKPFKTQPPSLGFCVSSQYWCGQFLLHIVVVLKDHHEIVIPFQLSKVYRQNQLFRDTKIQILYKSFYQG